MVDKIIPRDWQNKSMVNWIENDYRGIIIAGTGCVVGDTLIEMPRNLIEYPNGIKIKDLLGKKNFYVYSFNIKTEKLEVKKCLSVWSSGIKDIYEVTLEKGNKIQVSSNHPFLKCNNIINYKGKDFEYVKCCNLKINDNVMIFNRNIKNNINNTSYIKSDYNGRIEREHRFIIKSLYNIDLKHSVVHHIDGNHYNNSISNLKTMSDKEHSAYHTKKRGLYGKDIWKNGQHPRGMFGKSHNEISKYFIGKHTEMYFKNIKYTPYRKNYDNIEFNKYGFDYHKQKTNELKKGKQMNYSLSKEKICEIHKKSGFIRYYDKIIDIKHIGKKETFDMEVEDNHNFIGNNFILHNSGKTIDAILKILKLRKNTLIVVPTETLMLQWEEEIKKNIDIPHEKIGLYYGKKKEIKNITIAIRNSISISDFKFDKYFKFCIYDELHNMGSETYLEFVKSSHFKYILGITATIERKDNTHYDLIKHLGGVIYTYDEKEAKKDNVINKFSLINCSINLPQEELNKYNIHEEKLKKYMDKIKELTGENRINPFQNVPNENQAVGLMKMHYRKEFSKEKDFLATHYMKNRIAIQLVKENKNKKILLFNSLNKNAKLIYDILNEDGIKTLLINSTNKNQLKKVLDKYKNEDYNVLITTNLLNEGYNLPSIDVGIIVSGTSTKKDIKQRIGRIIRKKDNPSVIYQLFLKGTRDEKYNDERTKYIDYADEYLTLEF